MIEPLRPSENFSEMRHALRTPLNHIIGYAEMLLEDAGENTASSHALQTLISEGQRVCDLIQGLGTAPEPDGAAELEHLQTVVLTHASRMHSCLNQVQDSRGIDLERIRTAVAELIAFGQHATMPPVAFGAKRRRPLRRMEPVGRGTPVLVVDDDEGNRDILQRQLERQGYRVTQAGSGSEALAHLRSGGFEAVLLDLIMPGMNGLDFLDALQADLHLRDIPVLVISASDDLAAVADSIQRGAEDYLFKPFDPVLLQARLSATLERKRLRDGERLRSAELERLTEALKRSNEDLQRFAYAASHDLQAPVRTITTYIQLLQRRLKDRIGGDEREMFAFAEGAARRMHALIHDLLEFSQATTIENRLEPVDANGVLDSLVLDMDAVIQEAAATVTREPLPKVVYDSTRMRQIFQNLIGNAIKYRRDEPPRVHVSARDEADHWLFRVQDNGEGIAPEHLGRIFEMFQRLHGDDVPGSGIGLSICKRLIERSGGKIWVESNIGAGSSFFFTVPYPELFVSE